MSLNSSCRKRCWPSCIRDFYRLWQQLQKTPADRRGALYDEAFGKAGPVPAGLARDGSGRARTDADPQAGSEPPLAHAPRGDNLLEQVRQLRPQVAEYDAVREEVRKLLAMPMAKHWPTLSMSTLRAGESSTELGQIRSILNELGTVPQLTRTASTIPRPNRPSSSSSAATA